jgi:hypothetical protein
MANALDSASSPWEQIHGNTATGSSYIPPFSNDQLRQSNDENYSPEKIRDKIYDFQVEYDADPNEETINPAQNNQQYVDQDRDHHREDLDESEANRRQIKDMKFIRVKIKTLRIDSDHLISRLID